jgi:hypothetical protein
LCLGDHPASPIQGTLIRDAHDQTLGRIDASPLRLPHRHQSSAVVVQRTSLWQTIEGLQRPGEIASGRLGGGDKDDCSRPFGLRQLIFDEGPRALNFPRFR